MKAISASAENHAANDAAIALHAVVSDALDAMGLAINHRAVPLTGVNKLVGRCRTTLWADMATRRSESI